MNSMRFIIIDTLQKVREPHGAEAGNIYACDYDAMVSLKKIADKYGIGILLVHHLRKTRDNEDPFNELIGSNGVMGGLDTSLLLKRECCFYYCKRNPSFPPTTAFSRCSISP